MTRNLVRDTLNARNINLDVKKAVKLREAHRKIARSLAVEEPELIERKLTLPPKTLEMTKINLSEALDDIGKYDKFFKNDVCEKDEDIAKEV